MESVISDAIADCSENWNHRSS